MLRGLLRPTIEKVVYAVLAWLYPYNRNARLPQRLEGKYLTFTRTGTGTGGMGHWDVSSRRGKFVMGWIDWNPQWRAYHFRPHHEGVFNGGGIAEIYAFLRDLGTETGRFV
jgi:hypothetical protein